MILVGEQEARDWVATTFDVSRDTMTRLEDFADLLRRENERQNLVSRSTLDHVWTRHIADSAQLLRFAPSPDATWLDLGTGAGFPGLIVASLHAGPGTLVESRRLRVEFLEAAAATLGIKPRIVLDRLERLEPEQYDVISARAFARTDQLLRLAHRFSTEKTRWILPKGRTAHEELAETHSTWQGEFRLEPSLTDPDARIIIAEGVRPRAGPPRQRK
jgi:16S rRNA (guanine527-N7)-methyltransferase